MTGLVRKSSSPARVVINGRGWQRRRFFRWLRWNRDWFWVIGLGAVVGMIVAACIYSAHQHPTSTKVEGQCIVVTTRNGFTGDVEKVQRACGAHVVTVTPEG